MKIIIPMAGMGKRMRPHTLTIPKPLIPIAGKPIVHRLVEDIVKVCGQKVEEIAFVIGSGFGEAVENKLKGIASQVGAKASIVYQEEPLGTAHAILCAKESLEGNVVVAFADTLFKPDFQMNTEAEGIIWVQKVEDPSAFGVIKTNEMGEITDFVEKPKEFVSDMAIIGIYFFKDGAYLREELQYLIDHNLKEKGEFQLTNALENMKKKGTKFKPTMVSEWLDCGNKDATVFTNQRYLEYIRDQELISKTSTLENSIILKPCYIAEGVEIRNSVIGPHVSIGKNTMISNSIISNSIIQEDSNIRNANLRNSMLGNAVLLEDQPKDLSLGDYNVIKY